MKRTFLSATVFFLFFSNAEAIDPTRLFQRGLQNVLPGTQEQKKQEARTQTPAPSTDCNAMLDNSPKARLVDKTASNMLKGAVIGAAIGAAADDNRLRGAIIGGIMGALSGTVYTMATTRHMQPEDYDKTAKRLGYNPSQGDLLKVEVVSKGNKTYRLGEYAEVVLRVSALTPEKNTPIPVWISTYLVGSDGRLIPMGSESYYVLPGTTPFVYYFPVCSGLKDDTYRLSFQITTLGRAESHEVELKVSSR